MRVLTTLLSACLAAVCPALAQDDLGYGGWDLLPSPGDVVFGQSEGRVGACGADALTTVDEELQQIHERQGMCGSYGLSKYRDFYLDMRAAEREGGHEPSDSDVGDYETVANYFNYHDETWWDGRTSPGYREAARRAGQVPPGLTAHYQGPEAAGSGATSVPEGPDAAPSSQAAAPTGGALGACGVPVSDDYDRFTQEASSEEGTCAAYVAEMAEDVARYGAR